MLEATVSVELSGGAEGFEANRAYSVNDPVVVPDDS
jgi:hypothetical protein